MAKRSSTKSSRRYSNRIIGNLLSKETKQQYYEDYPFLINDEIFEKYAKKIEIIQNSNTNNILELGKCLKICKAEFTKCGDGNWREFLRDKRVKIGRTQADKYIKVYEYYENLPSDCQSAETIKELGIEKICLIKQLPEINLQIGLGRETLAKNLTVSCVKHIVNYYNAKEGITLRTAIDDVRQMLKGIKPKDAVICPKPMENYYSMYYKVLAEKELLEEENKKLKEEMKQLKEGIIPKETKEKRIKGTRNICKNLRETKLQLKKTFVKPLPGMEILVEEGRTNLKNKIATMEQEIYDIKVRNKAREIKKRTTIPNNKNKIIPISNSCLSTVTTS